MRIHVPVRSALLFLLIMLFMCVGVPHSHAQNPAKSCSDIKPYNTKYEINLIMIDEPYYDLTKSIKQINQGMTDHKQEWLKTHGLTELWSSSDLEVRGKAVSGMDLRSSFLIRTEPIYGAYACLYFTEIKLELFYRTLIAIPNEFEKDSCDFIHVNEHELKHHNVNKQAVQKFYDRFHEDVKEIVYILEDQPYATNVNYMTKIKEMQDSLKSAIEVYFQQMMAAEMRKMNEQVDVPKEYRRVRNAIERCKHNQ